MNDGASNWFVTQNEPTDSKCSKGQKCTNLTVRVTAVTLLEDIFSRKPERIEP